MLKGKVVFPTIATIKHVSMEHQKLMLVQPLMADESEPDGDPLVAIDCVGAGIGDFVVITSDGRFVRERVKFQATPIRWAIIGIEDKHLAKS